MELKLAYKESLNQYFVDWWYQESDNGDYGITINRILAIIGNSGQIVFGAKNYDILTPVTIINPISFIGMGDATLSMRSWLTRINTTSPTDFVFNNKSANKVIFKYIHFTNKSTTQPTAGAAIRIEGLPSNGGSYQSNGTAEITQCSFTGFYDSLYLDGAQNWNLYGCSFNGCVRYNVYVDCYQRKDQGDSVIQANSFFSDDMPNVTTKAHIYQVGSGGLRVIGNKFNYIADYCYLGEFPNNETSILLMTGNSFENYRKSAVKITTTGVMPFRLISIGVNQFSSYNSGTTDIDFNGVKGFSIQGNIFNNDFGGATRAINLNSCNTGTIINTYLNYSNPVNVFNCSNVLEAVMQAPTATNINI